VTRNDFIFADKDFPTSKKRLNNLVMLAASRTWSSGWEVSIHAVQGVITSTLMCFGFALYRCYFCYTIFLGVLSTYIVEKFRKPDIGLDLWFGFWISV